MLHPEIASFLVAARECFPDAIVAVMTNGVLLPKMGKDFWQVCRENRISIWPTKYPIDLDYESLEKLAAENGVEYHYFSGGTSVKTMAKFPLDCTGLQDEMKSFVRCHRANNCLRLQNGRLYTCTVAPNIRHFNKKFGMNLQESPADSIDIYAAKSAEEIVEFLARPIPFCRYCMPEKAEHGREWNQSKFEMSEWTL